MRSTRRPPLSTLFPLFLLFLMLAVAAPSALAEEEGLLERAGQMFGRVFATSEQAPPPDAPCVDAPRRITVLPAVGQGTAEQLDDVRTAIHNSLSSRNFELKRPQETDLALAAAAINPESLALEDPERLVKVLQLDGLVYIDVLTISKVYAGAYAQQEVSVRLRLYSATKKAFIWEKVETQVAREGGLSLNLLGILTTVITSTKVLTEGVRQALVDRLARNFASAIPHPVGGNAKAAPPTIAVAFSNWGDGPFRAGDEVIVYLKGEPGLAVTFDLGRERAGLPMREKASGEYLGAYVVREDDQADNQMVVLHATRLNPRASLDWRVPGRVGLDNKAPAGAAEFKAQPVREGVRLTWKNQDGGRDAPLFTLERSDPESGVFSKLAEVATSEYLDQRVSVGHAYHYRITPHDAAKNTGPVASVRVVTVTPGPTAVSGDISEDTVFHALGSPYRIQGPARVARNITLALEPGSTVEFGEGASLEILGAIQAMGASDAPVSFVGSHWRLRVSDTGSRIQQWRYARFEGIGGGVEILGANARFENCIWRGMATGLQADEAADIGIQSGVFAQNQTGLRLGNSRAKLERIEFRGNETALLTSSGVSLNARDLQFDGNAVHVDAAQPLDIGAARFRDASYADLLPRLRGPVQIDWRSLPEEQNLLRQWLKREWHNVVAALRVDDLANAAAGIKTLAPIIDDDSRGLAAAIELLAGGEPSVETAASPFARAARSQTQSQPGSAWIWIQETNLPFEPALADAPSRLLDEAAARFSRALASQHYPNAPAAAAARAARLDLARHQRARLLLPGERDGAYWRYQVAYLLDRPALERDLRLAGVVERDKSTLVVGLLNQSERGDATQKLADALQKQKIRFINLGQGGVTARAQEKAREAGVNLVVETRYALDIGQTRLSTTLKRFEAHLTLNLYDVGDTLVLQRFTATGSSADFRESSGIEKALGQAFGCVEADLLASLWRLDEARLAQTKPKS